MRNLLKIFGYGIAISQQVVLYLIFLVAYFLPTKTIVVNINSANEAHFEFVILLIALAISLYGFYKILRYTGQMP